MAFEFAVALNIPHKSKNGMAGKDWLRSFLRRNYQLSVRKAESVSLARGLGMTRARVNSYFNLLQSVLQKYNLFEKPGHIFNMDETGL
ncbi:hypothetical protein PPYR_02087 [Photinus pyralis]|uniref:HTH CENPB-type domain-containing protein n=1 Tax=Photinus pyralis TaxID=7054 RepID=A0A5N4B677_PHOPY|nr:hypothetical protein PPYR_01420 [Photinus pyralis]KAB0805117.1 hypothetical protein PPYR_02087 [Photinus pyralis]